MLPKGHPLAPQGAANDTVPARPAPRPLTPEQQRLVTEGLPLVERLAATVARRYHDLISVEELLGPGTIALCEAARVYRRERHPQFTQYAQHHVHGRLCDAVRTAHFSLRARVENGMERAYSRMLSHQVLEGNLFSAPLEELDAGADSGCDDVLAATFVAAALEAEGSSPEEQLLELEARQLTRETVVEGLDTLYTHERQVVELVYERRLTLDEVAEEVRVPSDCAQRRHRSGLRKLRKFLVARGVTRSPRKLDV